METIKGKTFLFDTNIYNHLYDLHPSRGGEILRCIKGSGAVISTVPQILGELAETFKSNPEKGHQLCEIYAEFIDEVLLQPPELLLAEAVVVLGITDDDRINAILKDRGELFGRALSKLRQGQCDENTAKFIEIMAATKKRHHDRCKESIRINVDRTPCPAGTSFDQFWRDEISSGRLKEGIIRYLNAMVGQGELPTLDITRVADYFVLHIESMPHLKAVGKIVPIMNYRYFLKGNKAKRGDLEDSVNLIAAANLDGYVSDDAGVIQAAQLMFPEKIAISLNDFLKLVGCGAV